MAYLCIISAKFYLKKFCKIFRESGKLLTLHSNDRGFDSTKAEILFYDWPYKNGHIWSFTLTTIMNKNQFFSLWKAFWNFLSTGIVFPNPENPKKHVFEKNKNFRKISIFFSLGDQGKISKKMKNFFLRKKCWFYLFWTWITWICKNFGT